MAKKKKSTGKKAVRKKVSPKKKASTKKKVKSAKKKSTATKTARKKVKTKTKSKTKTKTKSKSKTKAKPKASPTKKTKTAKSKTAKPKSRTVRQEKIKLDTATGKIREKLVQNRTELLNIIQSSQTIERNSTELNFSNEIDMASSLEGREMMFQLTSRDRNELKMIEEALYKIDTGTYGICDSCSKKISPKRLQILPLSSLCIDCKESMEHI
ncbi:hypothetical protein UZ36_01310 [Candidatus Nitromaritima sp. SCGC AAA799-C22]|nr:hypothetical protein UZ36_01310 [Candidatus Nitromaritima sp. SCGC AAA799-C22]